MKHFAPSLIALLVALLWLSPAAAQAPRSPHGHWLVTEINNMPVNPGVKTTFDLAANGLATGSGGCNRYRSKGKIRGSAISFGPAIATRKMCLGNAMTQESAFFSKLPIIRSWQIADGVLSLADGTGRTVVRARLAKGR